MKKIVSITSLLISTSLWAALPYGSLQDQAAELLKVEKSEFYNLSEQVVRTTTGVVYQLSFSYDIEEFDITTGYELLTYNCSAQAKGLPVLTPESISCELEEGTLIDEF